MPANVILWTRTGHADSEDAVRFLKAHRYGADQVRDLAREPPRGDDLDRLAKGLGGLWPLVDLKASSLTALLPHGEATAPDDLRATLAAHPELLRTPILLTPKGAVAGFREQRWRAFLDIGKGRS